MNAAGGILFGTGGVPESLEGKDTVTALAHLRRVGLDAMELEFVRGTFPGPETARKIAETARNEGIRLTAHAPYFVNLNSAEPEKVVASRSRILKTARIGLLCGVESITFHAGFYLDAPAETVYPVIERELGVILDELGPLAGAVDIRPETTGKPTQFGTVEEILRLSRVFPAVKPCIDWSHLHARSGACNTAGEFRAVLDTVRNALGGEALQALHMHVSGIEFGPRGEKKHLDLRESDFGYEDLLFVLKEYDAAGFLICESPHREKDALLMKEYFGRL